MPPEQATVIEEHISECEPCCETIFDLSSSDTFVDLLCKAKHTPTEQTVDQVGQESREPAKEVPEQLAEHPRYEIIELIGKGGMGDVYKGRHRKMERTVALKVINRELFRKTAAVDRFHREVKAAAKLSHPNIVTAHDADQAGDFHFMVMEYVDGVDLSQLVKQRGALPINEACEYTRQAAHGLQHAHEKRMVHRDIKPHNLMVTDDGTVKILDFGLASLAPVAFPDEATVEACGDLTVAGAIMGTPDFISPEQAKDAHQADIRSDIYSLGATLYFLLTGRPPFAEGSVTHKLKSHSQAEPEPLENLRHDLPPKLLAIVSKMMAKDSSERFQTPAEVAEVLESVACETERPETPASKPIVQPRRRKPGFRPITAVAALLLGVICAATVFYLQTNHGTVRIELNDPSLEVSVKDHTITLSDGDGKPLTIRPGDETLIVRNGDADFQFETKRFQIRRRGTITFKVEILPGEIVVRKDGEVFDRASVDDASTAADKAASVGNLRQIARAFMMFEHEHGYLPSVTTQLPGAKHPVSWRVAILKYLDEDLYNQYRLDEPWYSNHNKTLLNKMPSSFRHPGQAEEIINTCYVTLVGENTATGNGDTPITDIDGARTILVTEGYTRIPWTKPGDHSVNETTMLPSRRPHRDGWNVVFVDGSAHFISAESSLDELQALIARNGSIAVSKTDTEKTANREAEFKTDWSKVDYKEFWLTTDKPLEEVRMAIQEYYVEKYPLFADLIDRESKTWRTPETLPNPKARREIGEFAVTSPVTEEINPSGSSKVTFMEGTRLFQKEALVTIVNLYQDYDKACRISVLTNRRRGVGPHETYPSNEPITKNELRKLIEDGESQETVIPADEPKLADFDRAQRLAKLGKLEEAAESYLDAYRLAPGLLAYEQFLTIKKANRTREFVEVFTVDRLKQVTEIAQPAARILRDLLKDEATCLDGNVFLKNMWRARPQETSSLLSWRTDEVWDNVTDTVFLIRDRVLPTDIKNEGAGWKRFTIDRIGDKEGTGSGLDTNTTHLDPDAPGPRRAWTTTRLDGHRGTRMEFDGDEA